MTKPNRQSGAFILASVVFLMVVGAILLYSMTNLSQVASTTEGLEHNANQAEAAALSGLKYCLAGLETGDCNAAPTIAGISPTPCAVSIIDGCSAAVAPISCTVTSTAYCPSNGAVIRGAKRFTIQVRKSAATSYSVIPASLVAQPVP